MSLLLPQSSFLSPLPIIPFLLNVLGGNQGIGGQNTEAYESQIVSMKGPNGDECSVMIFHFSRGQRAGGYAPGRCWPVSSLSVAAGQQSDKQFPVCRPQWSCSSSFHSPTGPWLQRKVKIQLCVFKLVQTLLTPSNKVKALFRGNKSFGTGMINLLYKFCHSDLHAHADINNQASSSLWNQPQTQHSSHKEIETLFVSDLDHLTLLLSLLIVIPFLYFVSKFKSY